MKIMRKINIILAFLAVLSLPSKLISQYSELEVKNMISQATEKEMVVQCSRMLQENFFHFADLITDALLKTNPKSANYKYRKGFIELTMRQNYLKAIDLFVASTGSIDKITICIP